MSGAGMEGRGEECRWSNSAALRYRREGEPRSERVHLAASGGKRRREEGLPFHLKITLSHTSLTQRAAERRTDQERCDFQLPGLLLPLYTKLHRTSLIETSAIRVSWKGSVIEGKSEKTAAKPAETARREVLGFHFRGQLER